MERILIFLCLAVPLLSLPLEEMAGTENATQLPFFLEKELEEVDWDDLNEEMESWEPDLPSLNTEPCVFPFTVVSYYWNDNLTRSEYDFKTYDTCAPSTWGRDYKSWCATTDPYIEGTYHWKYCEGPNRYCVFPFLHKGVNQTQCVEHEEEKGQYWCSLTSDYDTHEQREWCTCFTDAKSPDDCFYL